MNVIAAIASVSEMDMVSDLLLLNGLDDTVACVLVDCCFALLHKSVIEYW
jgi:hypothetical protein